MAVGRSKKTIHMEANLRPWLNVGQGSQCSSYRLPLDSGAARINRVANAESIQESHKGQGNSSAGQNQRLSFMTNLL